MLSKTVSVNFTPEQLAMAFTEGFANEQARFVLSLGNSIICLTEAKWSFQCHSISEIFNVESEGLISRNTDQLGIAIRGLEELTSYLKIALESHSANKRPVETGEE